MKRAFQATKSANRVWSALAFLFSSPMAYNGRVPNVRSCLVSLNDSEGIEHSVRMPAESLYEAAIEAMAVFRHGVLAEMPLGPGTRLNIRVKAPEETHTVMVSKVLPWLEGVASSPSEQIKKNRSRERLRK